MTTFAQGQSATLISQWAQYPGGPATDVTGITITITRVAGSVIVVGPTAAGITHPSTGLYTFTWSVPSSATVGDYLVVWNATDAEDDPVQASEIITVGQSSAGGACGWTIDVGCCPDWDSYSPAVQDRATVWATGILWGLSGRQFGECTTVVRPCYVKCYGRTWETFGVWMNTTGGDQGAMWMPYVFDGDWRNCGCCGMCCCGANCEVWLPGPVSAILEVKVGNVVVPTSAYRVDNGQYLVRQDGNCWPECQDFNVPADDTGNTFVVTYQRGIPLPPEGAIAAGELACEFAKACVGAACRLPQRVSSISRQGTSMDLVAATDEFENYRTGLLTVDQWLVSVNPQGLGEGPRVNFMDQPPPRITTWGM